MTPSWMPLAEVCEINPRLSRVHGLADDTQVSFVPMAAVDEVAGTIRDKEQRVFSAVRKGYTSFRDGDVLFAKITPCMENGKSAIARDLLNGVGFGSTEFHVLRPKASVLPEWIYYFVRREPFRWEAKRNFTGTAGQQRVPAAFLANCRIPIPPLDEQRRIVDLLSRAEGIVRLRREAQKKAAEIIPALFLDMFGDPATNPKGWSEAHLGNLSDVQGGLQISKARASLPLERPYLRVANVHRSRLDLSEVKSMQLTAAEFERTKLVAGDLLVVEGHGNADEIGRVGVWDGSIEGCVHQNHLIRVRCNAGVIKPEFACEYLNSASGRRSLLRSGKTTSGLNTISVSNVKSASVFVPPVALQIVFVERLTLLRSVATQQSLSLQRAESTFAALLGQVFAIGPEALSAQVVENVAV